MDPKNITPPVAGNDNPPVEGEETPPVDPPADPAVDADGNDGAADEEGTDVPADVLRANLTKANQEAARYRTRLREVEKALEGRKTEEDVQALLDDLRATAATEARNLLVENIALKHSLPTELAELLKGDSREELEAHALTLAKFAPSNDGGEVPPGDLDGGLNPGSGRGDDSDPLERVRKVKGYR